VQEQLQIGQYILTRRIGRGGMAEVWEARHIHLGNRAAVKFLLPEYAGNQELQERFLNEGKRQAQLQHPNIVPATDFFQVDGKSYLVMRFVDGQSLDARLEKPNPPLSLQELHTISWDVLSALGYAHSLGVIHRDVKPANMLLDQSGRTLLMDFGIAKALTEERSVTLTGTSMGTPEYMSPEQILRPKQVDARSDIYSFGCVLYAMCSGGPPFSSEGATAFRIQDEHVRGTPPPLVYANPDTPHEVGDVVSKCLEKDPENRYQSCGELMTALDAALTARSQPVPAANTAKSDTVPVAEKTPSKVDTFIEPGKKPADAVQRAGTLIDKPVPAAAAAKPASPPPFEPVAQSSAPAAVPSASGGSAKYLVAGLVAILLLVGVGYMFLHKNPALEARRAKDWKHVVYNDADFSDCMGVQDCVDMKAQSDKLAGVKDWKDVPYNSALFSNCMSYQPCTERLNHAKEIEAVTNWSGISDQRLLSDCMHYEPCLKAAPVKAPGGVTVTHAAAQSCADIAEAYPCCKKAPNPSACLACKQKEGMNDCVGIY
jgi:serine/threonine protein kinase